MEPTELATTLAPTGPLRASINLGNPVLAQGTEERPTGVTVDLATELARRLDVPVEFLCFDAARKSFAAMSEGRADVCFLAIDPERETQVAFTAPYVVIEGVYVVSSESPIRSKTDVDRPGVRVGVKRGSAYDLHLTRTLESAEIVRGDDGVTVFDDQDLDAGAGIRQAILDYAATRGDRRVLDEAFMQIRQAVGIPVERSEEAVAWMRGFVEECRASGFVVASLVAAGLDEALVAP
ncbi:MAG: transporter substrate-binding domain-containing protein [Acidimicrobiia bacterium]|nr:transporter substrate-binding domain-containing protein [Acidimicrobiia bacterium]